MTKCDRCGREAGNLFCGHCRAELEQEVSKVSKSLDTLVPVLYWDTKAKLYRAGCTVLKCPCNANGVCKTGHLFLALMKNILHEFDGDNIIQQACG